MDEEGDGKGKGKGYLGKRHDADCDGIKKDRDGDGKRRASSVVFVVVSPSEARRVLTMGGVGKGVCCGGGLDGAVSGDEHDEHDDEYGPGEGSSSGGQRGRELGKRGDEHSRRPPSRGRERTRIQRLCDNFRTTPSSSPVPPRSTPQSQRKAGKERALSPLAVRRVRRD